MNPTPTNPTFTSEFFVTLLAKAIAAVLAVLALIHPGFHESSEAQTIVPSVLGVAGVVLAYLYARGSSAVKLEIAKVAADLQKALVVAAPMITLNSPNVPKAMFGATPAAADFFADPVSNVGPAGGQITTS